MTTTTTTAPSSAPATPAAVMVAEALGERLLIPAPELPGITGLSRTRCYALIQSGDIETVRVGRRRMATRSGLISWLDRLGAAA